MRTMIAGGFALMVRSGRVSASILVALRLLQELQPFGVFSVSN